MPDSLNIRKDTIYSDTVITDTIQSVKTLEDSIPAIKQPDIKPVKSNQLITPAKKKEEVQVVKAESETIDVSKSELSDSTYIVEEKFKAYTFFTDEKDSSIVTLKRNTFENFYSEKEVSFTAGELLNKKKTFEKGWILGFGITSIIILLIIRINFQRQLSSILSSVVNFQIAEKLLRERNILTRRAYFLLDLNFLIGGALLCYIICQRLGINVYGNTYLWQLIFLIILIASVLIIRNSILKIIGFLFNSAPLFREYIHSSSLLNKSLGLYLLPLAISTFYIRQPFSDLIFYTSLGILFLTILYKYLRGLQIIMKYKFFYLYTILYLCSLEILPVLLGAKFILSLR